MGVKSISWHMSCLENMKIALKRGKEDMERQLEYRKEMLDQLSDRCELLEYQIEEAIEERKEKFDSDKYRIKKTEQV